MSRTAISISLAACAAWWQPAHGQEAEAGGALPEPRSVTPELEASQEEVALSEAGRPNPTARDRNEIVVTAPGDISDMRVPSTSDDKAAAAAAAARTPCAGCLEVSGRSLGVGVRLEDQVPDRLLSARLSV